MEIKYVNLFVYYNHFKVCKGKQFFYAQFNYLYREKITLKRLFGQP